jgi:hypothetical protein
VVLCYLGDMENTEALQVDIPAAHKRSLKILAVENDTTVSDIVRNLVAEYVRQMEAQREAGHGQ